MKIRKCPHCKSKSGFEVSIQLSGYQAEKYTFAGTLIDIDKQGVDVIPKMAECIDCGKSIEITKVKYLY